MRRREFAAADALLSRAVANLEREAVLPESETSQILALCRECLRDLRRRDELKRFEPRAKAILGGLRSGQRDQDVVDVSRLGKH